MSSISFIQPEILIVSTIERESDDPDPEDGEAYGRPLVIWTLLLIRFWCRTRYGAERNLVIMGAVHLDHAIDHRSSRKLLVTTQENSGSA